MKQSKRIIALVLSLSLLLTCGILPAGVFADSSGMTPVTSTETITKNGIDYTFTRKIQYVGGRTYNVSVDVSSSLTSTESAYRRTVAKSGYMTVEQTGWYILELWGGDGGDGKTSELNLAPDGEGGRGGYVYGKVYLKAGQTLAYSIGTDGTQSLTNEDGSGGANGSGGTHGDSGSVYVGGGGGFSALFLFDEGEFNPGWFNDKATGNNVWTMMPEDVRLSRYLMIAGGGGGGGAAPWITGLLGWAINGEVYAPNGGYGGRISSSYITLSGSQYDVEGYVFSGRDGYSSGESTLYVGQGGSTVPGSVLETAVGWFESSVLPNDWTGTYSSDSSFGAGGSGNFRGGAGGAGFCGGSGGIMEGALLATNIGGGGGGSSFLASSANEKNIDFLFSSGSEEMKYLMGYNNQPVGEENVGGALAITYMGADESLDTSAFENTSVTLNVTDNFYIFNNVSSNQSGAVIDLAADASSVTVTGLSIMPSLGISAPTTAHIQMQVIARDEFAGGNGVKLLEGLSVTVKNPDPTNGEGDTYTFTFEEEADNKEEFYVNVPLNLVAKANFLTSNKPGEVSFAVSELYTDQFAEIRSDLTADPNYAFIESIGTYSVADMDGTALTGSVTPTETTYYKVGYDVAVKPAEVTTTVGPVVTDCRITGTAVISVVPVGQAYLSGLSVNVSKSLSYADGVYTYKLEETQNAAPQSLPNYSVTMTAGEANNITVDYSGWYYIQTWGGNGGAGGSAYIAVDSDASTSSRTESVSASTGGSGGTVAQYVYLTEGTVLTVDVGEAGSSGTRGAKTIAPTASTFVGAGGTGGSGGTATTVKIGDTTLMIAGGGGGGGGSAVSGFTIGNRGRYFERTASDIGDTGASSTASTSSLSDTFDGGNGGEGTYESNKYFLVTYVHAYGGSAGSAGKNYKNSSYDSTTQQGHTLTETAKTVAQELSSSAKTGTGGQFTITLIETQAMEDARNSLGTMETDIAFSQYFDVTDVSMQTTYDESASFAYTKTVAADGSNTVVHIYNTKYEPGVTLTKNDNGYQAQYYATVAFTFRLKPKDGFLGGNDVPVVVSGVLGCGEDTQTEEHGPNPDNGIHITQGGQSYNPPAATQTDLANVALNMDLLSIFSTQNKTIHLGDSVDLSELYTFSIPTYTGDDAWKDDFVEFIAPEDATDTPTQDTLYPITVTLRAENQNPDALVVAPVADLTQTLGATVFVEMPITYDLTRLTADGLEWVPYNKEYQFTLAPEQGYLLPESITVTNASGPVAVNYDPVSGVVIIPADAVVGPLTVTAEGEEQPYTIYIIYMEYNEAEGKEEQQDDTIENVYPETVIDWSKLDEIAARMPEKPGYEFGWRFDTDDGERPSVMPAKDLWVYGDYMPKKYTVTVNYVHADTNAVLAPTVTQEVAYGQEFSILSPAIKGYLTDQTVIFGTQGLETKTYTVKYTPSKNTLQVVYVNAKGEQLAVETHTGIATGSTYSFPAKAITGYTPDVDTVSGTMTGDDSVTVIVKCTPKTYTLNFVFNTDTASGYDPLPVVISGATMEGGNTQKVEYANVFGYDPEAETDDQGNFVGRVVGLPKPEYAGYAFAGWYSDAALTQPVSDSDAYMIAGDTTLYAKWAAQTFKLTVEYQFAYEEDSNDFVPTNCLNESSLDVTGDFLNDTFATSADVQAYLNAYAAAYSEQHGDLKMAYGLEYTIPVPELEGYTAYLRYGLNDSTAVTELTGTMPAANRKIIVTYVINVYTVRFMDNGWQTIDYSDEDTVDAAVYQADDFNTLWKTVENVKHGVEVAYGGDLPNQATKETYTYTFTGWQSDVDGTVYPGRTPAFPVVKQDTVYYACYHAQENIISVTQNSVTTYYTTVAAALQAAESNAATATLKFRRNTGNAAKVNLDGDILEFGKTYSGDTTALSFTVDLNGLEVGSDTGATVLKNPTGYINLTVTGSGTLYSRGSGDVVTAIVGRNLTVNSDAVLKATSTGGKAVGIQVDAGTPTLKGVNLAVEGQTEAIGILVEQGGALTCGSDAINATVTANGNAYGLLNRGAVTSPNVVLNVTATGDAYGFANEGGTVAVSGEYTDLEAHATSTGGTGYGLYSNGGSVGSDGSWLSNGVISGSSYGIYCTDGSIFVSGNKLYFKGANEENALSDTVVIAEGYVQTEAYDPYVGYYRLAREHTITFVTNGGTEVKTIRQLYGTPLTDSQFLTTMRGYDFINWHTVEDLTKVYTVPSWMPDESLTLYAQWELVEYIYTLDTELTNMKVRFYGLKYGDTDLVTEAALATSDAALPNAVKTENMTYKSGTTLYIHAGWYTEPDGGGEFVNLSGDLSALDTNGDGVIKLYSKWVVQTQCYNYYSNSTSTRYDFAMMGTTANTAANVYVTNNHQNLDSSSTSTYGYGYLYYVVPRDGSYTVYYDNYRSSGTTSSYRKYVWIEKISGATTSTVKAHDYVACASTRVYDATGSIACKAGDVLVLRTCRYSTSSSYNSYVYGYVTEENGTIEMSYEVSAPQVYEQFAYNVTMGNVTLPIPVSDSGERFSGWSEGTASADSANWLMTLTPEMVEDQNLPWVSRQVMNLYANWQEATWKGYQSAGRNFSAITGTDAVTVRNNQTVTLRFQALANAVVAQKLQFASKLPENTVLTLVNLSVTPHAYYTYTVGEGGLEGLDLSSFTNMANGTSFTAAAGDDLLLQIDHGYTVDPADQTVSLWAGAITPETLLSYRLVAASGAAETLTEDTLTYKESGTVAVDIPSLPGKGFETTDGVYLRVSWGDLNMAPGTQMQIGEYSMTIFSGSYGLISLGTVADYSVLNRVELIYEFPTSVYWDAAPDAVNEFSQMFTYEVIVVPGTLPENVLFSDFVTTVGTYTQTITVTPIDPVTVSTNVVVAAPGETVTLGTFSYDETVAVEWYIYANVEGYLEVTEACLTLFDGVTEENGKLAGITLTDRAATLTVSATAEAGEYYVKLVCGDKYVFVQIIVT